MKSLKSTLNEWTDTPIFWGMIGILILLIIVFLVHAASTSLSDNAYNGGVCRSCGGHLAYQQAVGHLYTTSYIYICDSCGNMVQTGKYYMEGNK